MRAVFAVLETIAGGVCDTKDHRMQVSEQVSFILNKN